MAVNASTSAEYAEGHFTDLGPADQTTHNDENKKKSASQHLLNNALAEAAANKEQAVILLKGVPLLKAKMCIEVTGVGKGSGNWYCKKVVQEWDIERGYYTRAQLIRGEGRGSSGGGGNMAKPPDSVKKKNTSVAYADIYKPNTIVVTERKLNGASQGTFHYGKGETVVSFKYIKDGKAATRGGDSNSASSNQRDKKGQKKNLMAQGEPVIDGGGSIVTGD